MSMCRIRVHPSNGWVALKSTHLLVGFLLKIWMLGNLFDHAFISFYFLGGCHLLLVSQGFVSLWNVKKNHMTSFLNEICLINIQIISFNSFKFHWNEIWKIMQELIKIKHINFFFKIILRYKCSKINLMLFLKF